MEIKSISYAADQQSVIPAMIITFEIAFDNPPQIPISLTGKMFTYDSVVISHLTENYFPESSFALNVRESRLYFPKSRSRSWYFHLTAPISPPALDYIEKLREHDSDKTVHFQFDLLFKYFDSPEDYTIKNQSRTVALFKVERLKKSDVILQNVWLKTFAPYFKIGRFLLLELRIPEDRIVNEFWADLYKRLIHNLHDMEKYIREGEWYHVMVVARKYFENLKIGDSKPSHSKFKDEFRILMQKEGHSEEGINDLLDAIKKLFDFTSKFIHDKDRSGNLNPIVAVKKEDAYFVYSLSVGLLTMIGRKISIG